MKKLFLALAVTLFSFTANAQFSGGVNVGLPVGNASNAASFSFGVDVLYMFNSGEEFTYGIATGYQNYLGKTVGGVKIPSQDFIPLAFAGRYSLSDQFALGADVGYGIATNGGFYYRPMLVYNMSEKTKLNASYSAVSGNGSTLGNIGVGVMFDF